MRSRTSLQTALDGLSFRRFFLLLAPGAYREDERRDPDRNEEDVGHGGHAGREPDRAEERVSVDDQDEPAHGGAHDAGRQYADDVGRDGGGDQTTEEQGSYDRPRHLRQAEAEQEADARANGDNELAGIDGADDLTWLHASGREQRRRRDGAPSSAAGGVEEPGDQTQGSKEASRDGPYLDGTLVPPEGEAGEHEDAEPEQEDGDDRLGRLGSNKGAQHHSAEERPNRTRYRERPDFGPVHVPETPVGGARCCRRSYLGDVHARRSKGRRYADSQQQTLRSHPVSHAERSIDQLRYETHDRQQQEVCHLPYPSTLHFVYHFYFVYYFDNNNLEHNRVLEGSCQASGRRIRPNSGKIFGFLRKLRNYP